MRYIINADDYGRTETVNQAIIFGFDHQYLNRTSIMVNMPYFDQAVWLAETHRFGNKVGLHINLTSGEPLSEPIKDVKSFCGENGRFNGKIFKDKRLMLFLTAKEKSAVKTEICAQIDKYVGNGFTLMHADSHGHVHTFPSLQNVVLASLAIHSFKSVRIAANLHSYGFLKIHKLLQNRKLNQFNRVRGNYTIFFDSLKRVIASSDALNGKDGECEIMVHPNIWDDKIMIGESLSYENIPKYFMR